ncbi:FadR/GntR family transcriptional regulator [Paenactinomyces guangxiensis]|uniref:FadR family transcriptional regulator n=1 Tax=Paenactinomyces guangxiensis TaxID=1490290 RepID=A0A7W1WPK7_9BACL|nr:FadR/GntR family transcriptional regulator [Paenactinomyces guangxiensis]MBA4493722.1 FadR family transcriptional regulator [Paenactinomyces guangxiensis]MBH8591010.1 FadR family transcriptional regulator [Paenactinomyces guangxiensis]
MKFKQVHRKKLYEQVAEQIQEMITGKELKPGDKLASVPELAEQFGVGRSAIREALSALRAMGYLEMRQGEGTFVREFDPGTLSRPISPAVLMKSDQILELLEVRKIMEVGCAGMAALRRTEQDLEAMGEALVQMKESIHESEEKGEQADLAFHQSIAEATKNKMLMHFMQTLSKAMQGTMRESRRIWLYGEKATLERLYQEHEGIFLAIREHEQHLAQERMFQHIAKVEQVLRQMMKKDPPAFP